MIACALAGCAPSPEPREQDGLRIVSLNPCSDAILAEIAPGKLAAVSHYSHDPSAASMPVSEARLWPATGGSVEEIVAAHADLVVASSFLPPATRAALDQLGIPVVVLGMSNSVEENLAQVRALADAVGETEAGDALVARIERALGDAAPRPGDAGQTAILWQAGGIVPGDGALVVDLMRRVGLQPAAATRGLGQGDRLPLEAVLVDPPDILLHAGAQGDEQSRTLHHPALRKLDTRRAQFDPQLYFCGGPSLIRAGNRLAAIRDGSV
ncbi:cobalamin ABC transporter substrate-binding protein [Alteriqipengyuania lutimaris]|uniref:Cobalamin ABC transporter substrate-binding protein n=1 Tax=Alteriqipengyuania lutimaris TaxID=1538146 RepID=A0A395LHL3_9SPHN|nr:cobalamin ABC transporter substrate-binding protein [Alteriqipengyuania lutimaris]